MPMVTTFCFSLHPNDFLFSRNSVRCSGLIILYTELSSLGSNPHRQALVPIFMYSPIPAHITISKLTSLFVIGHMPYAMFTSFEFKGQTSGAWHVHVLSPSFHHIAFASHHGSILLNLSSRFVYSFNRAQKTRKRCYSHEYVFLRASIAHSHGL